MGPDVIDPGDTPSQISYGEKQIANVRKSFRLHCIDRIAKYTPGGPKESQSQNDSIHYLNPATRRVNGYQKEHRIFKLDRQTFILPCRQSQYSSFSWLANLSGF